MTFDEPTDRLHDGDDTAGDNDLALEEEPGGADEDDDWDAESQGEGEDGSAVAPSEEMLAVYLEAGRTHRQIAKAFGRSTKWVQRHSASPTVVTSVSRLRAERVRVVAGKLSRSVEDAIDAMTSEIVEGEKSADRMRAAAMVTDRWARLQERLEDKELDALRAEVEYLRGEVQKLRATAGSRTGTKGAQ